MQLLTRSFNQKRDIDEFAKSIDLKKEDIVTTYQDLDGTYVLVYYGEPVVYGDQGSC